MTQYIAMDEDFPVEKLARKLLEAGYLETSTLSDVIHGRIPEADETVELSFEIHREELVEHASSETLRDQLSAGTIGREGDAEDAVRYAMSGDTGLAHAMFSRVFEPDLMRGVERALQS